MEKKSAAISPEEQMMRDYLMETRRIKTDEDFRRYYRRFIQQGPRINLAIFTTGGPHDNFGSNLKSSALG